MDNLDKTNGLIQEILNHSQQEGGSFSQRVPLVFLDFDGVVNVPKETGYVLGEAERMANLNTLCLTTQAHIVLSTSWRTLGFDYCLLTLKDWGLDSRIPVDGCTGIRDVWTDRYLEIHDYLMDHSNFSSFVILDDIPMQALAPYAVLTLFSEGLNEANLKKALDILQSFPRFY